MEKSSLNSKNISDSIQSIIPSDLHNFNTLITNLSKLNNYSWEKDGFKILSSPLLTISKQEKRILKYLILKNVPNNIRPQFWLICSGAKREMLNNPHYYKRILETFPKNAPSPYENQIDMDLKRTFPGDSFFQNPNTLNSMKNILLAYTRRNLSIGYCQGFNFIVGRLVSIFTSEEEAFWVFVQIIESYLPINYYSEMAGIIVDQCILNKLICVYYPDLYCLFQTLEFDIAPITLQWFVSIFAQNLNPELGHLIWDVFFLDGSIVIFKAALGILKMLKDDILKLNTFEDIYILLESMPKKLCDSSMLKLSIILKKYDFDSNFLKRNRVCLEEEVVDNLNKSREKTKELLKLRYSKPKERVSFISSDVACNGEWPLCILDTEFRNKIVNHLVLKSDRNDFFVFDDYFSNPDVKKYNRESTPKNGFHNLLVERREHLCGNEKSDSKEYGDEDTGLYEDHIHSRKRSYAQYINDENSNYNLFISGLNSKYKEINKLNHKDDEITSYLMKRVKESDKNTVDINDEKDNSDIG